MRITDLAPYRPLYAYKPAWQGTVASQIAANEYLAGRKNRSGLAGKVIAFCAAFWACVFLIFTTPHPAEVMAGPGFETCTEKGC